MLTIAGFVFVLSLFVPADDGGWGQPAECRDGQLSVVTTVRELMARGDAARARQALESLPSESLSCPLLHLTQLSLIGWLEARALAPFGGAAERLGPVRASLDRLGELRAQVSAGGPANVMALQVDYANTVIQAAVAAAQDERPQMELLLNHALDLTQRIEQRGERAQWPRPYNLAAGELWFEVDRFDEARSAYERAVQGEPSAVALVGLARALARLGRVEPACATYKRVADAAPDLRAQAKADLARCR